MNIIFSCRYQTKYITLKKLLTLSSQLNNASFKCAVEVPIDILKFYSIATDGTFLKRIVKKQLISKHVGQYFSNIPRENLMLETFDEKFQQLVVGGIIDFYDRDYLDFLNPARYEHLHQKGPKVLTMENLNAGFTVCCVSMFLAFFAFIWEWFSRFLEFIVIKSTFNAFFQTKIQESRTKLSFKIESKDLVENESDDENIARRFLIRQDDNQLIDEGLSTFLEDSQNTKQTISFENIS